MTKKIIAVILALFALCAVFCGCGENVTTDNSFNIVCTIFPVYDWVRNITGDAENTKVELLLDSGTDLHSYQPTASDIITIATSDIFIYNGGESDFWINDVLNISKSESTLTLNLMEILGEENLYCAEETGYKNGHTHNDGEEHNHTHDEHTWLSPKKAIIFCEDIKNILCEKDPANKEVYEKNFDSYLERLQLLDKNYETSLKNAPKDTLVFADRFPFIYLTKDYGLNYFAAFSGCSTESEASFETVKNLADKTDELALSVILITETSDASVANTVKSNTKTKDQQILTINSLQSVTKDKPDISYIGVMEENLELLKTALS